jgi:ABC-2 type transport system permease protein
VVFPLLNGILYGSIFAGEGAQSATRIAVADEDGSTESGAFVARLKKSNAVQVTEIPLAVASDRVRRGGLTAFVHIPKGYGEAEREFRSGDASIRVGTDPARKAEAGMLQGVITQAAFEGLSERFANPASMVGAIDSSIQGLRSATELAPAQKESTQRFLKELKQFMGSGAAATGKSQGFGFLGPKIESVAVATLGAKPASSFEVTFPQAIVWGILGVISSFAISLVKERQQGTLARLRVSPMSFTEILSGKGLACFAACVAVMLLLLAAGAILFKVRLSSPTLIALSVGSSAFCFVGVMMLLSVLGKTEQSVAGSAWGVLIIMAMFGGGMMPVFTMPAWMQAAGNLSPLKWSTIATEGAIWRGFGLSEMLVPCGILLGIGALTFAAGVRILSLARD